MRWSDDRLTSPIGEAATLEERGAGNDTRRGKSMPLMKTSGSLHHVFRWSFINGLLRDALDSSADLLGLDYPRREEN